MVIRNSPSDNCYLGEIFRVVGLFFDPYEIHRGRSVSLVSLVPPLSPSGEGWDKG